MGDTESFWLRETTGLDGQRDREESEAGSARLDLPELDSPGGRRLYIQTPGRGAGGGGGVEEEGPKEVGLGITKNPPHPKEKLHLQKDGAKTLVIN